MPNNKEESTFQPADYISVPSELSSKRLLQYIPGLDRIHAINLMRKAYERKSIATDMHNDNSTSPGLHQGPQLSRHHEPQLSQHHEPHQEFQFEPQHCLHHGPHQCLHLCFDIIYSPLG